MTDVILSTREDKLKLNGMIDEVVVSRQKIYDARQHEKDVKARAKEELNIEPSDFKIMCDERYEHKMGEKVAKMEAALELEEELAKLGKEAKKG